MRDCLVWASLFTICMLTGCGQDSGGRVPAVGVVTLDGAPLPDVCVTFRPDAGEPGNGGFAVTDGEGRFEIYYPDTGKGLVPARYKVTVAPPPSVAPDGQRPGAAMRRSAKPAQGASYPSVYSSPEDTPLRVTVAAASELLKVELHSKPTKLPAKP